MKVDKNQGIKKELYSNLSEIVLAGGCFWGTQAYIRRVPGVVSTACGYANGHTENPNYDMVCSGTTGHAESVRVHYSKAQLSIEKLLAEFFKTINPTTQNRQGNDIGSQYRSGIYYLDSEELPLIKAIFAGEQVKYDCPIVTEVLPLKCFYRAEEYHQDYLEKNPNGYCHVDLSRLEDVL